MIIGFARKKAETLSAQSALIRIRVHERMLHVREANSKHVAKRMCCVGAETQINAFKNGSLMAMRNSDGRNQNSFDSTHKNYMQYTE